MQWKIIIFIILALASIITAALIYGNASWNSGTKDLRAELESARLPLKKQSYNSGMIRGLPAPVQKYLRSVLKDGQPMISAVSIEHTGTFNMSETGEQWKPFSSNQRVITRLPGFDWEAKIQMAPGLTGLVHDAYIAGKGILNASLFGLITLVNMQGTPEMAQGELMRFLAEAVWYPTALLPEYGVQWESVNKLSARATLKDGDTKVTLIFGFNTEGLVETVRAEARMRTVAGKSVPTPWECRLSAYETRDGMLIPMAGEVAWILPDGPLPYWRGHIKKIRYEF